MDILQIALIFLICLLTIFLTLTGVQVFFILKDLRKGLNQFNKILESSGNIVQDAERPIQAVTKVAEELAQKSKNPTKPKFYKKILK